MSMDPDQHSSQPLFGTDRVQKAASPDNPVFDQETFLDYLGSNLALAQSVVRNFLANSPARLAEIGTALGAGDATMVALAAHTLKGVVSFFAAPTVLDAVTQIEMLARGNDLQRAADAFATLRNEMPRLRSALKTFLVNSSS